METVAEILRLSITQAAAVHFGECKTIEEAAQKITWKNYQSPEHKALRRRYFDKLKEKARKKEYDSHREL